MESKYISKEKAREFVTKLGVNLSVQDKHKLLTDIVSRFMAKIPFQNVTMMAVPFEEREIPSPKESIKSVLDGYGGICFTLNFSMWCILKALDFDAHMLLGSVYFPGVNDHAIVLVKGVKVSGDQWLVDVGFGCPCFAPVNLDFHYEGEVITESHVTYKYQKRGDTYIRLHRAESDKGIPTVEDGWGHVYYFDLEPKDHVTISESINQLIFKTKKVKMFHESPRIVSFSSEMKALFFKDGYLLKEADGGKLYQENIDGDIPEVVHDLWPSVSKENIKAAMTEYERTQKNDK